MRLLLLLAVTAPMWAQFGAARQVVNGNGAPNAAQCASANNVGMVYARKNGESAFSTFYVCGNTAAGTYAWELMGSGGSGSGAWSAPANAQTGTTYTFVAGDCGKTVTFSNASAVAVTLPQAGASFPDGCVLSAKNIGNGDVTITPTTSTISGTTSITMSLGEWAIITSNGTNYEGQAVRNTAGTGITQVKSRTGISTAIDTAYLNDNYPLLVGGLVPTNKLGSGTADSSTFLRGDQTYSAPPAVRNVIYMGKLTSLSSGATTYMVGGGNGTTETQNRMTMPFACTARNLYVNASGSPADNNVTFTLRKEAADTSLVATQTTGQTLVSDTVNTVSLVAGDRVSIKVINTVSTGSTSGNWNVTFECTL